MGTAQFPVTVPWSQTPTVELNSDLLKVVMEPKSLSGRFLNKIKDKLPKNYPQAAQATKLRPFLVVAAKDRGQTFQWLSSRPEKTAAVISR